MSAKKIGVLGCGMIAELGHMPALRHVAGISLHAVYDVSWNRALAMQTKFRIPHAFPTEQAFWESDIDAVVICTPAPFHLAHVLQAAKYGKHVLCEKPLAMNEADIARMIKSMDEAGLMLFTGFTYRFSGSAKEIHRLIRSGAIGEVRALRLNYLWNLHGKWNWNEKGERIASPLRVGRMLEGGPMVDCGVHQIDLARWWLGSAVEWQRGIGVWVEDYVAPDHLYLHMGHACGAHTMVEMSFSYNATSREPRTHFQYELIGSDGVIRYNREEHSFELRNSHGTQWLAWHPEKNFAGMHWEFAHALETGDPRDMPTAMDGLLATRIARLATEEAIRDRERTSQEHPSTMVRAVNTTTSDITSPLDLEEPEDLPASTLATFFERTRHEDNEEFLSGR
jgi:predicted dehydrogenase